MVCLLIQVVFNTVWIVVDRLMPKQQVFKSSDHPPIVYVKLTCMGKHYFVWYGVNTALFELLMTCAVWLAFASRDIPQKDFKTRSITVLVHLQYLLVGLGFPLYFVLNAVQTGIIPEFVVSCILLNVPLYLCFIFLFLPPIMPLIRWTRFVSFVHRTPIYYWGPH